MPPTSSTSVWPIAVMPISPAWKRISRRLSVPNTPGAVIAASTTTAPRPASGRRARAEALQAGGLDGGHPAQNSFASSR